MAIDLKNLSIRTVSGLVYAGLLVGAIILGQLALTIVLACFGAGACYELDKNTVGKDNQGRWYSTWLIDASSLVFMIFIPYAMRCYTHLPVFLWLILIFFRFIMQIFNRQEKPIQSIAIFCFGQFYIGVPLALFAAVLMYVTNPWIIVCALSMIWINDTGAYLIGSIFGRHKMFPSLSPKKSWEGFLGGLLFNIGAAFIFYYCFRLSEGTLLSNVQGWIYIGMCVTAFATLGDLFESMLKRSLGIKDFGAVIPGHGGILDRIDSLLCVVPCLILALMLGDLMFGV